MKVRVGKSLKLSGALALMLTAGAGSAFATSLPTGTLNPLGTFDYNGLSYNPNTIITITNPPVGSATVYSTPVTLSQTGGTYAGPYNAGFGTLITWCLDIFDDLQGSSAGPGPYTIYGPGWTSSGNANPVLTAAQINEIGLLMSVRGRQSSVTMLLSPQFRKQSGRSNTRVPRSYSSHPIPAWLAC